MQMESNLNDAGFTKRESKICPSIETSIVSATDKTKLQVHKLPILSLGANDHEFASDEHYS